MEKKNIPTDLPAGYGGRCLANHPRRTMAEGNASRLASPVPGEPLKQEAIENLRIYLRLLESQHLKLDSTPQSEASRAQRAARLIDAAFHDGVELSPKGE